MLAIRGKRHGERLKPLERIVLEVAEEGIVTVVDGQGRHYYRQPAQATLELIIGGSAGYHHITLEDAAGHQLHHLQFMVDVETTIQEQQGDMAELLQMLLFTMLTQGGDDWGAASYVRYQGRIYSFFVRWLRDHVHVLKGMKYFSPVLKDGIELYRDSQRADGMIWDNVYPRGEQPSYWDTRFAEGDFIRPFEDGLSEFKRIPVEADVEYLFVEGLYYTWKAVNDDGWLSDSLDAAIKALEYCMSDRYRWSTKYQLIKRGYTIDTWDFQSEEDARVLHDAMRIDPDKTHFGIMFGDNTGYIASCGYLAEMLEHVGRLEEAARYRERASEMKERLDALSWNGHFYTHHVAEHPECRRHLGVDEASQVSLSNAYSLNRRLSHEQCVEIIRTYQHIRRTLPEGSPGEWYTIYPPFQTGFSNHDSTWQYMNGGVTTIVAGELAHGAFAHGFERYAIDILQRVHALGKQHRDVIYSTYTGASLQQPARQFTPIDLADYANIDISGASDSERGKVRGWFENSDNDLHELPYGLQTMADIPFAIVDPTINGRKVGLAVSTHAGYAQHIAIPLSQYAASVYFLHTTSKTGATGIGGSITLHYNDGTTYTRYVVRGKNVSSWWFPEEPVPEDGKKVATVAWRGKNDHCPNLGVIAYGLDNPHPERRIENIILSASDEPAYWAILGITLSDQPVYFPPNTVSFGIPDSWGAAAVVYAMIEGLAGVVDQGQAYEHVLLSPRWSATASQQASVSVAYPASQGYIAYTYQHNQEEQLLTLELTGSGTICDCHLLLPEEAQKVLKINNQGKLLSFVESSLEQSHYVDFRMTLPGPHVVQIYYLERA
ncbi:hypothetical protein KDA_51680 [Dictyobacter alpinus]|uniref:Alpha-L-rhamnosidase six-hairpin glycosidase domain-containing protein n=1 Tax=Dictyobacter alpinus TaxID=2014873 RepID=A0A402BE78_9CHLR|nr:hypothetical protein [Dictyobacter alpinus]GCE29684.1 hypothetical protein KDA_51680 [Dictyobacter alpinus]